MADHKKLLHRINVTDILWDGRSGEDGKSNKGAETIFEDHTLKNGLQRKEGGVEENRPIAIRSQEVKCEKSGMRRE